MRKLITPQLVTKQASNTLAKTNKHRSKKHILFML